MSTHSESPFNMNCHPAMASTTQSVDFYTPSKDPSRSSVFLECRHMTSADGTFNYPALSRLIRSRAVQSPITSARRRPTMTSRFPRAPPLCIDKHAPRTPLLLTGTLVFALRKRASSLDLIPLTLILLSPHPIPNPERERERE